MSSPRVKAGDGEGGRDQEKGSGLCVCAGLGGGEGGPRQRAAQTLPLPQTEPEGPEGPNLAAEKHGGAKRQRKKGGVACRAPQVPRGGGSKALTQEPRGSSPSGQPAAPSRAWPGWWGGWWGETPLPHGTEFS